MAASLAQAIAEVEGAKFDVIVGYSISPRIHSPVDQAVKQAFEGFDSASLRRIARTLAARYRCHETYAEDAVQDALVYLLEKRSDLYRQNPEDWLGLLHKIAQHSLVDAKIRQERTDSVERLMEARGDAAFDGARTAMPVSADTDENARHETLPCKGERWNPTQIIGALQRFRDYYGRPPKSGECKAFNGLPSPGTINKYFRSLADAIVAAGMVPDGLGRRRERWSAIETAKTCRSFRRRNGYWPGWADIKRNPGELPSTSAMVRCFGSTRPSEIQLGAEAILAASTRSE